MRVRGRLVLASGAALLAAGLSLLYCAALSPDLSWLRRSRDAARYLRPGDDTALLRPRARLCAGATADRPLVLLAVPSAAGHRRRRDAIRRTWGRRKPATTRLLFVLGRSGRGAVVPPEILEEAADNDDILVEDFIDSYHNLTLKTLFIIKWALSDCPEATYVLKVDDDVLVNVQGVVRLLWRASARRLPLVGRVFSGYRPHRWPFPHPQWALPRWLYAPDSLPDYLTGPSYALAGWALRPLLEAALAAPLLPLEDVFVTGVVADAAGLPRHHEPALAVDRPLLAERLLCEVRRCLTLHVVDPGRMLYFWRQMTSPKRGTFWAQYGLDACRVDYSW